MLTLSQFLDKWSDADSRGQLMALLTAWFHRSPRTLYRWLSDETPREAGLVLMFLDEKWEASGKNIAIFFDV